MSHIVEILSNPLSVDEKNLFLIQEELKKYPYCQPLHMVHLCALKKDRKERFQNILRLTSLYCSNRKILYDYLHHQDLSMQQDLSDKVEKGIETEDETFITSVKFEKDKKQTKKVYSFTQWLHVVDDRKENSQQISEKNEIEEKFKVINQFLEKNPKITPTKDYKPSISLQKEDGGMSHLMTETLAKIYVEQKKYDKAIQAYRILRLKYPEKSGYFADQVKQIENLKNN